MTVFGWFDKKKPKAAPPAPTPLTLQVGDIVSYDGVDWIVQQKLSYRQGGYEWFDYQLIDADKELWLAAEDDDGLFVAIYERVAVEVSEPISRTWEVEGHAFHLDEEGECDVLVESDLSPPKNVHVRYWDYEADDGAYLSLENWAGDWDVSIGKEIKAYELEIFARARDMRRS